MKTRLIITLIIAFVAVCGFAQENSSAARFERRDSIFETLDLDKRVFSIAGNMYFPPAEFYWNDTLYYMDRSPLAYINEKEFLGIYDLTGRRIDEIIVPGIYILDGKKLLVK